MGRGGDRGEMNLGKSLGGRCMSLIEAPEGRGPSSYFREPPAPATAAVPRQLSTPLVPWAWSSMWTCCPSPAAPSTSPPSRTAFPWTCAPWRCSKVGWSGSPDDHGPRLPMDSSPHNSLGVPTTPVACIAPLSPVLSPTGECLQLCGLGQVTGPL